MMKRRTGWLLMGLGCKVMDIGARLLDWGAAWHPVATPTGMEARIMQRLQSDEAARNAWLARSANWRDRV